MNCAKCGNRFFLHSPVNALWCEHDAMFLCAKCTPANVPKGPHRCPFCDHPVATSLSPVFGLAIVGLVLGAIFAGVFFAEASYRNGLQSTPAVFVRDLVSGERVRVTGAIAGTTSAPLTAVWTSSGKSGHWTWSSRPFELAQGSAFVWVDDSGLGNHVYGAPQSDDSHEWYAVGDIVSLVGTVTGTNGSLVLHADGAALTATSFADPIGDYVWEGLAGLSALSAAGIVVGYLRGLARLRRHEARARRPGMYDYQLPSSAPEP
ncbi:MAG: hypothetical protein L3K18_05215 [Thermoplasmata archaeon]|nr:hypothetical protein [Thermoplasmata archaeon]MCI4356525.1 hypothetical protein [Thermoplasmata archaeon]